VTAIDLDVIAHGFDLKAFGAMLKQNGPARTVKTVGRKMLGLDNKAERELCRQLKVNRLPDVIYYQMDAA
jgi:hypothetical protein